MKYVTRKFKEDLAIGAGFVVSCVEIGVPSTNVRFLQFYCRMFSLVGLVAVKIGTIVDHGHGSRMFTRVSCFLDEGLSVSLLLCLDPGSRGAKFT